MDIQPQQSPPTPPLSQENNINKILIVVVGILAVLIAIGGSYYFWENKQTKQQANTVPNQSPTQSFDKAQDSKQTEPDQFAGWKTYEDNEFGYSIEYPADLVVDTSFAKSPDNKISINIPVSGFRIEMFDNPNSLSAKGFFQDRFSKQLQSGGPPPQEPKTNKNININGNDAYQIEVFAFDGDNRITYLTKDNKAIVITYYSFNTDPSFDQQNVKLSDQILSTFRFTESAGSPIIINDTPDFKNIINKMNAKLGQPFEGYTADMYLAKFLILQKADFDRIDTSCGHLELRNGNLINVGNINNSSCDSIDTNAMQGVILNFAKRNNIEVLSSGAQSQISELFGL